MIHSGETNLPDQAIILEPTEEQTTYIYNNLLYAPYHAGYSNVLLIKNTSSNGRFYLYGNTLIGGTTVNLCYFNYPATDTYVKNNIFYSRATSPAVKYQSGIIASHINYNLYFYTTGNTYIANYNGNKTLAQMQSIGAEINGINDNPDFINIVSDRSLQLGSPAIDAGATLGAPYNVDILGTTRSQGTGSDIGAFEYHDPLAQTIQLNAKVFLEGAFEEYQMNNFLNTLGYIPAQQPYSQSPWNYNGNEFLQTIPSKMVDWVLVELRTSIEVNSSVYKTAGIVLQDGSIKSLDGISPLSLDGVDQGNYYIVIYHRNHLPILSSITINFSSTIANYDFTTSMIQAYGIEPMKEIGSGVFGMIAGDGDGNGGITIVDRNQFWQLQNGNLGYLSGDFNLDGGVTIKDCNQYWNYNNGKASQVP